MQVISVVSLPALKKKLAEIGRIYQKLLNFDRKNPNFPTVGWLRKKNPTNMRVLKVAASITGQV
jgi:hypothetical protein